MNIIQKFINLLIDNSIIKIASFDRLECNSAKFYFTNNNELTLKFTSEETVDGIECVEYEACETSTNDNFLHSKIIDFIIQNCTDICPDDNKDSIIYLILSGTNQSSKRLDIKTYNGTFEECKTEYPSVIYKNSVLSLEASKTEYLIPNYTGYQMYALTFIR